MNDERTQSVLEDWFKTRDTAPEDVRRSAHQVMERKAEVRQRSRWSPFPVFYRRTETRTTTDTPEYQPGPIPATHGHTPTVIGRTQTMLSPVKTITAGALVFAIGGVMLIAQPFGRESGTVPGAAIDEERAAPSAFSGRIMFGPCTSESLEVVDSVTKERGIECQVPVLVMSDPRLDGDVTLRVNADEYPVNGDTDPESLRLIRWAWRIENDGGTWQQEPAIRVRYPDGTFSTDTIILVGEGGYEGLTAVANVPLSVNTWSLDGYIIDGPVPVPPESAATAVAPPA